ncbi:MAG: SDR family NAD(P)-dependent oxidoreductase [Deltaproteobacteria bacterium]|nr:SDR family NAD(P)-dependent oxidoreductase [Deltaproteobacteria bacterium]MBI3389973.1 SDR family NAD(P)-dependent oxidoreductase [Deltaproteobacteria bacterium]
MEQPKPIALVSGVGPGTGRAIVQRFARGGYRVAMLARNRERLDALEKEIPNAVGIVCDVADESQVEAAVAAVRSTLGEPSVLIHNAVGGSFGNFLEVDPAILNQNFQVNTMGLLYLARRLAPAMIEAGKGAIVATGNTSAIRGKAAFAAFAPTKAAQRILAESMARFLGPKGVHVAYVLIDAVIDLEWTRRFQSDKPDEFFCKPDDIAAEVWHVVHQERSAWSFNVEVRPFGEVW